MLIIPQTLYKYLDAPGSAGFLNQPQVRFTDWRKLDDLMEIIPGQRPLTKAEAHQFATDQSRKTGVSYARCKKMAAGLAHDPEWERSLRKLFASQPCNLFICCLSERWDSGAMSALYCKKHTGFIAGYNTKALPARIVEGLGKVRYSAIRPRMPMQKVDRTVLAKSAITKSTDWDYQMEWRIASGNDTPILVTPEAVSELILGYNTTEELIQQAKDFRSRSPKTRIFHAYPHPQRHVMARMEIR